MRFLTIHTTTYNRGYILGKAYESLCAQTCKDFEWIITDDGSMDNTEELVHGWQQKDNGFPIVYNKLPHGGSPRALNYGISIASTPWFMMLDSDDHLKPETIEKVIPWVEEIKDIPMMAGIGFARCFPDGRYMKNQEPLIDSQVGYVDVGSHRRMEFNLNMEMCEVIRLDVYKQFPYEVWPTETFAPEQISHYKMGMAGYKLRWRADRLYVCDYRPDGLTRDNTIVMHNPMGYAMMYNQLQIVDKSFKARFNDALQFVALSFVADNPSYILKTENAWMTVLALPFGLVLAVRRYFQFKKMK